MVICKKCGSCDTVKNGIIREKQRYKCKRCGCNFVENDDRVAREASILKALNLIFQSLSNISYTTLEKMFHRDRSLIHRWSKDIVFDKWRSRCKKDDIEINVNQLEHYVKENEKIFDSSKPIFVSSGKLTESCSAIVILQPHGTSERSSW